MVTSFVLRDCKEPFLYIFLYFYVIILVYFCFFLPNLAIVEQFQNLSNFMNSIPWPFPFENRVPGGPCYNPVVFKTHPIFKALCFVNCPDYTLEPITNIPVNWIWC